MSMVGFFHNRSLLKILYLSLFLVFIVIFGVILIKISKTPFFIDKNMGMSSTHIKVFNFQPYFLWSFEKDSGLFVKVFFISKFWIPQIGNLWLSGTRGDVNLEPVIYAENNKVVELLDSHNDVKKYYKFGDRMNVEYITGESLFVNENSDFEICNRMIRICQVYDFVNLEPYKYQSFSRTGLLPRGLELPVLQIISELHK